MKTFGLTITMLFTMLVWPCRGVCPSNKFQPCAQGGYFCTLPANTEGYISYGADGKYTLTPFKTYSGAANMKCSGEWGDIAWGKTKYCCYLQMKLDINTDSGYSRVASEGGRAWLTVTDKTIRFGDSSRGFVYFPNVGTANMRCHYGVLGYWLSSVPKICDSVSGVPPSLQSIGNGWTTCGTESIGTCSGLQPGGVHWVRYGVPNKWVSKLVTSTNGEIPCKLHVFREDPAWKIPKFCQASPALTSFSALVGKWVRIQSCGGGACSSTVTVTEGVTNTQSKTITNSWTKSLTASMKSGLSFEIPGIGGGSLETSLSVTMSHTLTNSITNSLTKSKSVARQFSCDGVLYQWVVGAERLDLVQATSFEIKSTDFYCINDPLTPKCPPGFCVNSLCQQCTEKLPVFVAVVDGIGERTSQGGKANTIGVHMLMGPAILLLVCGGFVVAGCVVRDLKRRSYQEIGDGESESGRVPALLA